MGSCQLKDIPFVHSLEQLSMGNPHWRVFHLSILEPPSLKYGKLLVRESSICPFQSSREYGKSLLEGIPSVHFRKIWNLNTSPRQKSSEFVLVRTWSYIFRELIRKLEHKKILPAGFETLTLSMDRVSMRYDVQPNSATTAWLILIFLIAVSNP